MQQYGRTLQTQWVNNAAHQKVYTIWLHLHKVQKQENLIDGGRSQNSGYLWEGGYLLVKGLGEWGFSGYSNALFLDMDDGYMSWTFCEN